jgi:hypothetical protein
LAGNLEEAKLLCQEVGKKLNEDSIRNQEINSIIVRNIRWVLDNHPHPYPFRSVLASLLIRDGLSLSEASNVTGVPKTTLALQNRKPKSDLLEELTYYKLDRTCSVQIISTHSKSNVKLSGECLLSY